MDQEASRAVQLPAHRRGLHGVGTRIRRPEYSQAVYFMMNTSYGDRVMVNARVLAKGLGIRLGQTQLL